MFNLLFDPINISLISTALLNFFLGLLIFISGKNKKINIVYSLNIVAIISWILAMFFYRSSPKETNLLWCTILYVTPTLIASSFLYFTYIFPSQKEKYFFWRTVLIFGINLLIIILVIWPGFIIKGVSVRPGLEKQIIFTSYYWFYFLYTSIFFSLGFFRLFVKYSKSIGIERLQIIYLVTGYSLATNLAFVTNLIMPWIGFFFLNWLGQVLTFIMVVFTTYAIFKHHLLNIKIIATELFALALCVVILIRTFLSNNFQDLSINIGILVSIVLFGILLITSVIREVEQKEKMEQMAKDIEKAYESEKMSKEKIDEARVEDEALLSSIGDGVIAIDKTGKIMFINEAAEKMLGYSQAEAVSKQVENVLLVQNEKGEPVPKERNWLYNVLVFGEKIIGAVDVFRDITVEKQIDKSKSEFVSLASHQLRTPLTAIKWYAEVLMRKKEGNNITLKQKKYLREILHGNERMIKLIDVMLNVSRLEAGKVKINLEPANIKELLTDIIKEQKFDINHKKQKFTFFCQNGLPEIMTDKNLFRLVFQNLISNAIKYTPDKGEVSCKVEKKDENILIEVEDTGIGIPKDQQKRIFEKLFRADNAFSHTGEGNGLGLYAAKATVENLGGKIWFNSEQGKGTEFFVNFPIKT